MTHEHAASEPLGIVGTGRVACAMGRLLQLRGESVGAVAGRSVEKSVRAGSFIGGDVRPVSCAELPALVRRVLIAVPDSEIAGVARTLAAAGMRGGLALHTSGALGPNVLAPLRGAGVSCAVLHPLQSIASAEQGLRGLTGITFGLGGDAAALAWSLHLVQLLESRGLSIGEEGWVAYHAGAAIASNGLIAILHTALLLLGEAGIGPREALDALSPLCATTLQNAVSLGPRGALTGPIARGDVDSVALHVAALTDLPAGVLQFYKAVSLQILAVARERGLPQAHAEQLERLLRPSSVGP
ncbi:MAG: DUF2520 domain-containing protein [Steroidobacteraceae bacterium]|jgi:predicted short-subunit dehydrogenase-like oxidoreductase (DUF2520 family)